MVNQNETPHRLDQTQRGTTRLKARLQGAWRSGGFVKVLMEIRRMLLWRLHHRLLDRLLERAERKHLRETTHLDNLTITSANKSLGVEYTPTPVLIARLIHRLVPQPYSDWNFIDIGAGRGRVVAQAARQTYRSVSGVEFAGELARDARAHIASRRHLFRSPDSVEIIEADATAFPIPLGPNVYFLFNPFGVEVLEKFLARISDHAAEHSYPVRIIYYNPVHSSVFESNPLFRREDIRTRASIVLRLLSPFELRLYSWAGSEGAANPS